MDKALLNEDKNNKIIRTNHRNIENQINLFISTLKNTRVYQTKTFFSNNGSGKPPPDYYNTSRQQSPYRNNYRGKSPDRRIHEMSHKIDIVDQTVKTINIEIIIQDQTQTEVTTQIITEIVDIRILEIDTIQTTVPEIPRITERGIIQTK